MANDKTPRVSVERDAAAIESEIQAAFERVKQRAFELSQLRGPSAGELANWYEAERQVQRRPPAEILGAADGYRLRIEVPGYAAEELDVRIGGGRLMVRGQRQSTRERSEGQVLLCETSASSLFRDLELPADAAGERATATLAAGVLEVNVPRTAVAARPATAAPAAAQEAAPPQPAPAAPAKKGVKPPVARKKPKARGAGA